MSRTYTLASKNRPRKSTPEQLEVAKAYYYKNQEKILARRNSPEAKESRLQAKIEKREFLTNYKKTLSCSRCGFNNSLALQFHHRNPEEKTLSIADFVGTDCSIERLMREINKCDVLCANCHQIEHAETTHFVPLTAKNE